MPSLIACILLIACAPSALRADPPPKIAAGAKFGLGAFSYRTTAGERTAALSVPGTPDLFGQPVFYLSFFPTERWALEPHFSFARTKSGNFTATRLSAMGQIAYLRQGVAASSGFVALKGAVLRNSTAIHIAGRPDQASADHILAVGAGYGRRWVVQKTLALRLEGQYLFWSENDLDAHTFSLLMGIGKAWRGKGR